MVISSLESNIGKLLKPVFSKSKNKKKDFLLINDLNKNWQQIIGEKYWQFCSPKKITFDKSKKTDGLLTLSVSNSTIAFCLEASQNQIVENIASYYGYKIISRLRIMQEPVNIVIDNNIEITEKISSKNQKLISEYISEIKDENLKNILQKLGKSVFK